MKEGFYSFRNPHDDFGEMPNKDLAARRMQNDDHAKYKLLLIIRDDEELRSYGTCEQIRPDLGYSNLLCLSFVCGEASPQLAAPELQFPHGGNAARR